MSEKRQAPYGSWSSPITADLIVSGSIMLMEPRLDGDDTYWIEGRPAEAGRCVVVQRTSNGVPSDITPAPFNVRTRVHEYGGGAYVVHDGTVYFSNFTDNRLYRQKPGNEPQAITSESPLRFADLEVDSARGRIICVREDHSDPDHEAINTIAAIDLTSGAQEVLVSGNDFYSSPRLSPDGSRLAWITWNHPNMPWEGTELHVAELDQQGRPAGSFRVAGGKSESVLQPRWSPDGVLYFVSDRTDWWNIYRLRDETTEPVTHEEREIGAPHWVFGMSSYAFTGPQRILYASGRGDTFQLTSLHISSGGSETFDLPYTQISSVRADTNRALFLAASPTMPNSVVSLDLESRTVDVLKRSNNIGIDESYISQPQPVEFPTENGVTSHGNYYAPTNPDFAGPPDEKPPLILGVHGGPTGLTPAILNLQTQFWTSRGFAVLDVNYGGSAGYGRAYRERLNEQWGVVDVDDAINGAQHLVQQGKADPDRLIIHGGSAGGYTTLAALAFRDFFAAGASYFGISDLEVFIRDTHKFESRYIDGLVGPYPETRDRYRDRSPIHHTHRMNAPVIIFQGLEDKVVPPNQAEIMVEGLQPKGIPYAYIAYEGEGHGFRRAENIKRTLEAELYFYSRIFGFELPDPVEPVDIENAEGVEVAVQ